jgi:glycosyltransferase involved in cell wall biosynthesis
MYTELLKDEFELTVITAHIANEKTKSFVIELDGNVTVVRIPYVPFNRKGFFWRGLTILSFSFACMLAIKYVKKGSIIYTCGPPEVPYFAISAKVIKFLRSAKQLGLVTDMIPDVAYDIGLVKSKTLRKIVTQFCAWGYRNTDHILTTTNSLCRRLTEYYGIQHARISIIGTPVDVNKFRPKPINDPEALKLSAVKGRFIVLYSGSFGKMYDFDPILQAAKSIQEINDRIFFIIRGDGEQKSSIQEKIIYLDLKNTALLGPVPDTEQIISFINIASVCLEPIRDSLSIDMTHPSKIFEYWACCKPIICTTQGETAKLIERCQGGIVVPPRDPRRLISAILYLFDNRQIAENMGKSGRDLVRNEFSYESVKERLVQLIYEL